MDLLEEEKGARELRVGRVMEEGERKSWEGKQVTAPHTCVPLPPQQLVITVHACGVSFLVLLLITSKLPYLGCGGSARGGRGVCC